MTREQANAWQALLAAALHAERHAPIAEARRLREAIDELIRLGAVSAMIEAVECDVGRYRAELEAIAEISRAGKAWPHERVMRVLRGESESS